MTTMMSKLRTLFAILLVACAINISAPKEAQANELAQMLCAGTQAYPVLNMDCVANGVSAFASAIGSAVNVVMQATITQIQVMFGRGIARAQMQHTAWLANREAMARHAAATTPGAYHAGCRAETAVATTLTGNTTPPGTEQPRPVVRVGRDSTGRFPRVNELDARGSRPGAFTAIASDQFAEVLNERQRSNAGPQAGAIADFAATRRWRPCTELPQAEQAACEAARESTGERPFADIAAQSLMGADTFDGDTEEIRNTRADEALAYCVNLMVPGTPYRPDGASNADAVIADAVQRAGDARVALAVKACTDAAARRLPIPFDRNATAYSWVVAAACAYRSAFNTLGGGDDVREMMTSCDDADASPDIYMSQLELMRVISSDIFGSAHFSTTNASATPTELQRVLIAMEAVNAQLNFETLRLQEHLGLIQAAELAADVKKR